MPLFLLVFRLFVFGTDACSTGTLRIGDDELIELDVTGLLNVSFIVICSDLLLFLRFFGIDVDVLKVDGDGEVIGFIIGTDDLLWLILADADTVSENDNDDDAIVADVELGYLDEPFIFDETTLDKLT
ncbi:unnamed protein product [[Candida] boidinii]|nr:unnamed protein product [[Candida] boidinii]